MYYGSTSIYSTGPSFTYTSTWTQTVVNASKLPDDGSYGILVTLNLNLLDSGSYITLYLVDLTFKKSSISFSVGLLLAYRVQSLELLGVVHQIWADFKEGDHTFTLLDFKLGIVHTSGSRPLNIFYHTYGSRYRIRPSSKL